MYNTTVNNLSVTSWQTYLLVIVPGIKFLMKRKFKQRWSSVSPISTKWTITSHLNWTHWTQKTQNMACLNWSMWSQLHPLDNWISNGNYIHKQTINNLHRFTSTQEDYILWQKVNDNINMDSTIGGLMSAHSYLS